MNQYKQAWMMAVDILPHVRHSDSEPKEDSSGNMISYVEDAIQDHMVNAAIITGLSYMATNTFANPAIRGTLGIVGKIGIRALPVIGAIAIGYSLWQWLDD